MNLQERLAAAEAEIAAIDLKAQLAECKKDAERLESIAQYLYKLLDDIDTIGDMAKADDVLYRVLVEKTQVKKGQVVAECDGYTVTFISTAIAQKEEA